MNLPKEISKKINDKIALEDMLREMEKIDQELEANEIEI
jgi:hypothetical protein